MKSFYRLIKDYCQKGIATTLLTVTAVRGNREIQVGQKLMVAGDKVYGNLGELNANATQIAEQTLKGAGIELSTIELGNEVNPHDQVDIIAEPFFPTASLVILGGGHIAMPLAAIGQMVGFHVTVIDDRPDFASRSRFSQVENVICEDFSKALQRLTLGPSTYVIIVTRGHRYDAQCLEAVAEKNSAYIGMIGSRRRVKEVISSLVKKGVSSDKLARVYTPIGIDIGAETPEEIAVSIIAEVINVYRGGKAPSLSGKSSALTGQGMETDMDVIEALASLEEKYQPAILATIVKTRGSTPRKAGSKMLVFQDGRTIGTIGGGCGEAEVKRKALEIFDSGLSTFMTIDLTDDFAAEEGMVCGGHMLLWLEHIK